ncbi:2-oxoisovalerate dehydrogenase subunit alpha, mitochondrial [Zancudomyces culisetae]|uniref:2-oxoisovalerate dehydrogenase subunit alpha n=1 Tax=Zancudomyces culisetae TaxID=1213189 RepID=A0A1R1PJ75_ZANCU|nr:2-oxoisovalerate dehydrogenase subunit alpha, mitochondrial [Zancudomyces culisetae]|eukprot:OMH81034.1 2-oxoisovalerate dehydrogenase subunit alpha, mitochondrial [Zancudomyces culisetae]
MFSTVTRAQPKFVCAKMATRITGSLFGSVYVTGLQKFKNTFATKSFGDAPRTDKLTLATASGTMSMYSVMDANGVINNKENEPTVSKEDAVSMYKNMLAINHLDQVLYEAQRQGRISFYMTSHGEEALVSTALALDPNDYVYTQYRELGVFLQRGYTIDDVMNQCFSNKYDPAKGRQMPVHYGSKKLKLMTVSSPLATQIPQAAGTGYALKREGNGNVVMCYFGDGAASEGDFHAALNMAATLSCPTIFFCRNNGYAISTPSTEQYKGDGIVSRGAGYGIASIRVDGNDLWALYNATKAARDYASTQNKPVLIEAMTYRVGHHSTSDDSTSYRPKKEAEDWTRKDNPITRYRRWLEDKGWWNNELDNQERVALRRAVLESLSRAEKCKKPNINYMFTDVYDELTQNLKEEIAEMQQLVNKYPDYYKINEHSRE